MASAKSLIAGSYDWSHPDRVQVGGKDHLPDFSVCGCPEDVFQRHFPRLMPKLPSVVLSPEPGKDRTKDIQKAIDELSQKPLQEGLFRGYLQLKTGEYLVDGDGFVIKASGVVVQGEKLAGGVVGTKLICRSKCAGGTLFKVLGELPKVNQNKIPIKGRLGIGETRINLDPVESAKWLSRYQPGDWIRVTRVGSKKWVHQICMDNIPKRPKAAPEATQNWPETHWLSFDRRIEEVLPNEHAVIVNVGLTSPIEPEWVDDAWIDRSVETKDKIISHVGIQNMTLICECDMKCSIDEKTKVDVLHDEAHLETAVAFDNCINSWMHNVHAFYFGNHTRILRGARFITVQYCTYNTPAAKVEGAKRYGFNICGQMSLVQYCDADKARHAFVTQTRTPGPNVFYRCTSSNDLNTSETHERWASGILYDNVKSNISVVDRAWFGSGQGWSGAYCLIWNCEGKMAVQHPPTAWNFAIGEKGKMKPGKPYFPKGASDSQGYLEVPGKLVPASLFDYQRTRGTRES